MGRVHKKKIAQYQKDSEAAEIDEQSVASGSKDDSGRENTLDENNSDVDDNLPLNANSNSGLDSKKNSITENDGQFSEHEDDSEIDGDESDTSEKPLVNKNGKKAPTKRKITSKKSKNDDDAEHEYDPLEKNGVTPPKRGKPAKGGKRGRKPKTDSVAASKKNEKVDDGDEEKDEEEDEHENAEVEYEVKDVVGHKVEKGVNYYLIRWKGYSKEDDSWESEGTLSCQDLIDKYNKKHNNSNISSDVKKGGKKKSNSNNENKKRKGKPSVEDPNKEWEVDKIIDYSEDKSGRTFRIRWKGFGPKFDTWEPEDNLSCSDLIQKFMKKIESQKDVSFKHLRKTPKKTKRLVNETAVLPKELSARKSKRAAGKKRITYADSDE